jgi:hypothetical protein
MAKLLCEGCGQPINDCICPPAEWYEDPATVQERIYELSHDMTAEFVELHRHSRDCNCPGCNGSGDDWLEGAYDDKQEAL